MRYAPIVISLLLIAAILWRNLSGALLCLWPGLARARKADEGDPRVDAGLFEGMAEELEPLGFRRLGTHLEQLPLRRAAMHYDFASETDLTFATAFLDGREARLYLLTAFRDGAMVVTADHPRTGVERPDYLCGGIPGANPEELLATHRRRVDRMVEAGHQKLEALTLEGRVELAQRWFADKGARELRLRNVNALLLSLIGFVLLFAIARGGLRALGG